MPSARCGSSRASSRRASGSPWTTSGRATRPSASSSNLPVDELKIDRTFVRDLLTDPADAATVQSVVDLGGRLGLRIVAEGVEDARTLDRIAEYGVTVAQGYHIARPSPADELERRLAARAVAV